VSLDRADRVLDPCRVAADVRPLDPLDPATRAAIGGDSLRSSDARSSIGDRAVTVTLLPVSRGSTSPRVGINRDRQLELNHTV